MNWSDLVAQLGVSGIAVFGMAIVARAAWIHIEQEIQWYRLQLIAHETRLAELEKRVNSIK